MELQDCLGTLQVGIEVGIEVGIAVGIEMDIEYNCQVVIGILQGNYEVALLAEHVFVD